MNSLTGIHPFPGKNINEIIKKNKECIIIYDEGHWKGISLEAKDLVMSMLEKSPLARISAKDALTHHWFTMEHTQNLLLSNAQENIKKYRDEKRFNVERIKPEFSMITCSPLLSALTPGTKPSPLILSREGSKNSSPLLGATTPLTDRGYHEEVKMVIYCPYCIETI